MAEENKNKKLKEEKRTQTEITKEQADQLKQLAEKLNLQKSITDMTNVELKNRIELKSVEAELAHMHGDRLAQSEAELGMLKDYQHMQSAGYAKGNEQQQQALEYATKMIEQQGIVIKNIDEEINKREQLSGVYAKGYKEGKKFLGGLASSIGMASDMSNTFYGKLLNIAAIAKRPDGLRGLKDSFDKVSFAANASYSVLVAITQATIGLVMSVDKAAAAFAKQTGAGRLLQDEILNVGSSYRRLGITSEDAGKAAASLYSNYPGFTRLSKGLREEVMTMVAGMEKLGLAADDSTKLMTHFTKNFGKTAEESMTMIRGLASTALSLQMSVSDLSKSYLDASKTLSVYGAKSMGIFKQIAAMARAAGAEVSDLLGLAQKFDTFEGAAKSAGVLNAVLGTQIDAMQMLQTHEGQRLESLLQTFEAQGINFKALDKYTQLAVAKELGFQDMDKARKILSMSTEEYRRYQRQMDSSTDSQSDQEKRMQDALSVAEKLKMAIANLAIAMKPLVDMIVAVSTWILETSDSFRGFLGFVVMVSGAIMALTFFIKTFTAPLAMMGVAMGPSSTGIKMLGKASQGAAPFVGALALAIDGVGLGVLLIGLGIGIILIAMAALVISFIDLGTEGLTAAQSLLMVSLSVAAIAFAFAKLALVGSVGAAIFIALIAGLAYYMSKQKELTEATDEGLQSVTSFVGKLSDVEKAQKAIEGMAGSLALLSTSMWFFTGGGIFGSQIDNIIAGFEKMGDSLQNLAIIFSSLATVASADFVKVFEGFNQGLDQMYEKINTKTPKGAEISHTLENLAIISTGKGSRTGAAGGGTKKVVEAIKELGRAMRTEVTVRLDVAALTELMDKGVYKATGR